MPRWRARLLLAFIILSLSGCSLPPLSAILRTKPDEPARRDVRVARVLEREGVDKLAQHRYEDASRLFNAGLKFSPDHAQLHFLNGLTYHLLYLRGDETKRDLAQTGYELALNFDPAHDRAALQLGRLEFEAKRYDKAATAFRHAIDVDPQSGDGYHGLAAAAYYAGDVIRARAAVERAVALMPGNAETMRAAAMIYAAVGDHARARDAAARHAGLERDPRARTRLATRIDQWRSWHASPSAGEEDRAASPAAVAQAPTATPPRPTGAGEATPPVPAGAAPRSWFDCGGIGGLSPAPSPVNAIPLAPNPFAASSPDDLTLMPSLPPPCQGAANPRMVVLDIALVRTETNASTSYGINLLDGLTVVFNRSRVVQDLFERKTGVPNLRDVTVTSTQSVGTPSTGIQYSLNIANATDGRSEMLARPSLVALDRMPSTFFSGTNLTLGISGEAGGTSTVTDRPIGVGLSVTPTFVDNETVLLAVKATRSFIEGVDEGVKFAHTLQTSRNTVSANVVLKMGQTLILSGLAEQEIQRNSDGVPLLRDVPALQYLFSTKTTDSFTRSVLVLITPRLPASDRELMARTIDHIDTLSGDKRIYRPLIEQTMKAAPDSAPGNLEGIYRHVLGNKAFLQFRSGDLAIEHWSDPPRLERLLRDLKDLLYH